jgi:thymidylate kinase
MHSGFLLVIEGIDGAGKSTLQCHLAAWCRDRGLARRD